MNKVVKKQNGQVLPFIIVAGTVLLAVIANLSLRNISSGYRSTTLDTAARVTAAAEGGLERYLSYSYEELGDKADECPPGLEAEACVVSFESQGEQDEINAQATVSVETFGDGGSYNFTLRKDKDYEVILGPGSFDKNNIDLCWDGTGSDVYYFAYGTSDSGVGQIIKGYICNRAGSGCSVSVVGESEEAGNRPACGNAGFYNGIKIGKLRDIDNLIGLRLRLVGGDEEMAAMVYTPSGSFPAQGFKITSTGLISQSGDVQATETEVVEVSYPFLPSYFDFSLFSSGDYF